KQRWGPREPLHRWTRTGVTDCLVSGVVNWCALARTLSPEGAPEAVWLLLDFLADTGRLDPASDPLGELRKPLRCYGGLDAGGRHGTIEDPQGRCGVDGVPRCECYVVYQGPTHGEMSGLASSGAPPAPPDSAASVRAASSVEVPGPAGAVSVPALPTAAAGSTPCA